MTSLARRLVSTNKHRYKADGFDLDLSYVTERVIAMGFPCDGLSSLYRNPITEVARFLDQRHHGHYRVYNLCIERSYPDSAFSGGTCTRYELVDGQAPPVHTFQSFCQDALVWLDADPRNVVVVHCKAGKGRTGAFCCALLLHLKVGQPQPQPTPRETPSADLSGEVAAALAFWAKARTKDGKGLTIPSQRRFVSYYAAGAKPRQAVYVRRIVVAGLPLALLNRRLTLSVWRRPHGQLDTHLLCHALTPGGACMAPGAEQDGNTLVVQGGSLALDLAAFRNAAAGSVAGHSGAHVGDGAGASGALLDGDLKVQLFKGAFDGGADQHKHPRNQFWLWASSAFLPSSGSVSFSRPELDKVHKRLRGSSGASLCVTIEYELAPQAVASS